MIKDITVYLADDHTLFRRGMTGLLETFDCIAHIEEAENGRKLIDLVAKKIPDVVLLDIRMPVMDGFDTAEFLMQNYPSIKVIVLSMENAKEIVIDLVAKGAKGYLSKAADPEEVERAIQSVLANDYFINEHLSHARIQEAKEKNDFSQKAENNSLLTPRELEILKHTCNGLAMRQIASALFVSERTVQNHRSNMMRKLGVNNAHSLVLYAVSNHLIEATTP